MTSLDQKHQMNHFSRNMNMVTIDNEIAHTKNEKFNSSSISRNFLGMSFIE